jgi:hypothetical protein
MWTAENRKRYERSHLRYLSDLTDGEWQRIAPLIRPAKHGGRKRTVKHTRNHQRSHVLNLGSPMQKSLRIVQTATRKIGSRAWLIGPGAKASLNSVEYVSG